MQDRIKGAALAGVMGARLILGAGTTEAQDAAAGEAVYKKCAICHQVGEEAKTRVGPVLNGIVGAPAGQAEGFRYSPAMAESGIVWDEENLTAYLADPRGFLPRNKMAFPGLRDPEEIADVIAYLATFAADGTSD